MRRPRALELGLWECQGIQSPSDVVRVMTMTASLGLIPGVGAWTREGGTPRPVGDIPAHVAASHRLTPAGQRAAQGGRVSPSEDAEAWVFGMVRPEQPHIFCNLSIGRRGDDCWHAYLLVSSETHPDQGLALEDFCASWGPFVAQLGDALYPRARPVLGTMTATDDESLGFAGGVRRRNLIVGWRTWFGPAYVQAFGREWLMHLPDWATPLADSGVAHGLHASPLALVQNDPQLYASIWPSLEQAKIEPYWPRARRARRQRPTQAEVDHKLTQFRRELSELLGFTVELEHNQRVKVFGLELGSLSSAERSLALHAIRETVEHDLATHPQSTLRLEVYELPSDLQAALDELRAAHPRFSYTVLPSANGHAA